MVIAAAPETTRRAERASATLAVAARADRPRCSDRCRQRLHQVGRNPPAPGVLGSRKPFQLGGFRAKPPGMIRQKSSRKGAAKKRPASTSEPRKRNLPADERRRVLLD